MADEGLGESLVNEGLTPDSFAAAAQVCTPTAGTLASPRSKIASSQKTYTCEFECGFTGSFADVASHEATCACSPAVAQQQVSRAAAEAMEKAQTQDTFHLEKMSARGPTVHFVASVCGVDMDRRTAIWGAVTSVVAFVVWGVGSELVYTLLAYVYPMYASFLAISRDEPKEVCHWLRYWVTFSVLYLVEIPAFPLLTFRYHHLVRIGVVVWLFLPATNGAQYVYGWLLQPLLRRYRPRIEHLLSQSAREVQGTLSKNVSEQLQNLSNDHKAKITESLAKAAVCQMGNGAFAGGIRPRVALSPVSFTEEAGCAACE